MIRQKRFWKEVSVVEAENGYAIALDGRQVKTPLKTVLEIPTQALAARVAAEWDAIEAEIDPNVMPATRLANSAIDKVAPNRHAVAAMLAEYAATDLLCYRATGPATLAKRQAEAWDPILAWVEDRYTAAFEVTAGILPIDQEAASLDRIGVEIARQSPFDLAALHEMITITGSALLGLALFANHLDAETAWSVARIDEDFQSEQWGVDEEAQIEAEKKKAALCFAAAFLGDLRN